MLIDEHGSARINTNSNLKNILICLLKRFNFNLFLPLLWNHSFKLHCQNTSFKTTHETSNLKLLPNKFIFKASRLFFILMLRAFFFLNFKWINMHLVPKLSWEIICLAVSCVGIVDYFRDMRFLSNWVVVGCMISFPFINHVSA